MSKQPIPSPGTTTEKWPRIMFGTAVFGIFIISGLFFWSGRSHPAQLAAVTTAPILTPTAAPSATSTPLPPSPTAVPSLTASATNSPTATLPPATATFTATATQVPATDLPATPVLDSGTAVSLATSLPWPTTNPTLLRQPPTELDLSRSHLWFPRPVDGNNNPSASYRFGMTYNQRLSPHHGVDIANDFGTLVLAVDAGTVFYAGEDIETLFGPQPDFYGRLVVIEMADKWEGHTVYTLFGHLESVNVTAGQPVNPGDIVGLVGSSGVSLGPHLHFEVRQDDPYPYNSVRNPELWYTPYSGRGVLAGRVVNTNNSFMPGTRVNLECSDATPRYVDTYWDQFTVPDDILAENFVISDLPAGTCRVWAELAGAVVEQFVEIRPGELSGVVLQQERP